MVFDSDQSLTVLPPELQFAPQHVIWQSWIGLATVVACQTFLVVAQTLKLAAAAVLDYAWTTFVEVEKLVAAAARADLEALCPLNCPIQNAWLAEAEADDEEAVPELQPLLPKVQSRQQVKENGARREKHLVGVPAGKHWEEAVCCQVVKLQEARKTLTGPRTVETRRGVPLEGDPVKVWTAQSEKMGSAVLTAVVGNEVKVLGQRWASKAVD